MSKTISELSETLGKAENKLSQIGRQLQDIDAKALETLKARDAVDAAIVSTAEELLMAAQRRDQTDLGKLAGQLGQQLSHRAGLDRQHQEILAGAHEVLAPIGEIANAALAVVPTLRVVEKNLAKLPGAVVQELFKGVGKIAWKN